MKEEERGREKARERYSLERVVMSAGSDMIVDG